jgi:hypothetical protein
MASVVGDIGDRDNGDRIRPEPCLDVAHVFFLHKLFKVIIIYGEEQ